MGKKSSAPAAPDPVATANAQAAANKETAIAQAKLNMVNQVGPSGTLTYTPNSAAFDAERYLKENQDLVGYWTSEGRSPFQHYNQFGEKEGRAAYQVGSDKLYDPLSYTATTTLSPEQQALYDKETGIYGSALDTGQTLLNNAQGALGKPLDLSSLGGVPQFDDAYRRSVADAMYARQSPSIEQDRKELESRLAAQGINLGSAAYDTAMTGFGKNLNDLRLGIDASAGNEASRAYANALQGRNQGINEMTLQRNQPINEITGLLGLGQVQTPNFGNTPQTQIQPTDVIGPTYAAYNAKLNSYNQGQQNNRSFMGGLFGLAGAGLPFLF